MQHVSDILALWSKLTGFDPEARQFTMGGYDVYKMSEAIGRAQALDPTDALALMLVESFLDSFLDNRTFRASQILSDLEAHFEFLKDARELRRLLQESGMPEAREELKGWVFQALAHYGAVDREDVKKFVAQRDNVAFLWRDALEAMETSLETHQFMQGEGETAVPTYHGHVLQAFTVNGLLQAMTGMPSGILIALIRDPEAIYSYFVFGIRNGGTLTIMTDKTPWEHPFQKRMARRPDRHLDDRLQRSWFPYSCLDIRVERDEEGNVSDVWVPREEGLVPNEFAARRLKPIRELPPEETVWIAMMFNLIGKRFFRENRKTPELSYLGEQVKTASGMEVAAHSRNLPVTDYQPLLAEPIKSSELTFERVRAEANTGGNDAAGHNRWMEDRYKDKVDDAHVDLVALPDQTVLRITQSGKQEVVAKKDQDRGWMTADRERRWSLERFDATAFGTRERLLADRVFVARYNQAQEIERLAVREFEERKAEIEDWWLKRLKARKAALLEAIPHGAFEVESDMLVNSRARTFENDAAGRRNILAIKHLQDFSRYDSPHMHSGVVLTDDDKAASNWTGRTARGARWPSQTCAVKGFKTAWRCRFRPDVADDLAALAGVARAGLPDVLRHWSREEPYIGNHILNRLDPLDWSIKNPWRKINFDVDVWLSESGFSALVKKAGALSQERFRERAP